MFIKHKYLVIFMQDKLIIRGARMHNLKNISLELPRDKFIVITGLSGSGKSSLAFDTIYAEGQRRYVESLSAYARQFLSLMDKPDVDSIEGLSPAISIEQKTTSKNPRSTVGTVTEIYDYLRLFFARLGTPHCPIHHTPIERQSATRITEQVIEKHTGKEVTIYAPVVRDKKGTYETLLKDYYKDGYVEAMVNGKRINTNEPPTLDRYKKHNISIIIDTVESSTEESDRLQEAIETATGMTDGLVQVEENLYSEKMACNECGYTFDELQPRLFSFNTPYGACTECSGLGKKQEIDPDLVIPDPEKSIMEGALAIYGKMDLTWRSQQIAIVGRKYKFDMWTPLKKFTKQQLDVLLYGTEESLKGRWSNGASMNMEKGWEGVIPQSERLYHQTESDYRRREFEKYMRRLPCPKCKGKRLNERSLSVLVDEKNIMDITELAIEDALQFFLEYKANTHEETIAKPILKEIRERLTFLNDVGLSYLNLSRAAGTLSGGEAQRIRLATQIGANLTGVLYVLDEPSIGLHQRDNLKLIKTLHHLRDLGNTLVVVEHDEDTIQNADHVVDIGPGAGVHGGEIIAQGTVADIKKNTQSLTGQYLSGKKIIDYRSERRTPQGQITIHDASENNLKNITVNIPTGVMTVVSGVSGSGKSTLVHQILYKALMKELHGSRMKPGKHKKITGLEGIEKVIIIDQSPIGKTPRSNPATYTKVFDDIRALFASTTESKLRGYSQGRFSFNIKGGRCEKCQGDGTIKIEMNFLPDVYVECDECKGKRYNKETLEVTYRGKNIADVLDTDIEEALSFFEHHPSIRRKLTLLNDVGLGYLKLGQSSTTLSGGESQRIKLSRELSKRSTKKTIYLLDEPTTGLHFQDINMLLGVLNKLTDAGSSMVIIEHNLDIIKNADWIIDIGPEGGKGGGEIIAQGTPETVAKSKKSYTAKFLKPLLKK
jgi:excinuclease ABC subunit A